MEYVHSCGFCGWGREATSEVMLAPRCEACGCTLEASVAARPGRSSAAHSAAAARASRLGRPLAIALGACLLVAAGNAGYTLGGAVIALIAVASMAFLLLPFVRGARSQ